MMLEESLAPGVEMLAVVLLMAIGYWSYRMSACGQHALATLLLPMLHSLAALTAAAADNNNNNSNSGSSTVQLHRWLQYWVIYGTLATLQPLKPLIALLPILDTIKSVLLLWCAVPQPWNGTPQVYNGAILPLTQQVAQHVGQLASF